MSTCSKIVTLGAALGLVACGGASTGSGPGAKPMTGQAADAPPPPSGSDKTANRAVSKEASSDFAGAVKMYQQKAAGGWTKDECSSVADKFIDVAEDHKNLVEAWYNAGLAHHNCKNLKSAEKYYVAALKVKPNHGPSLSNLGQIYFSGNNESRAKQYWEKADLKTASAQNNLAWLLIQKMRNSTDKRERRALGKEATDHLQRALAVENDNTEAYVLFSLLYQEGSSRNRSRLDIAKLLLDQGEKKGGAGFAPLHNARGLLRLKRGNVSQALKAFEKAVELDGKFVEARMNVGNIVLGFRKYDDAKTHFGAVLSMRPKSYDATIGLGIAQRGLKDFNAAEATYNKAIKLDRQRGDAYFNLGLLYYTFRANASEDLGKSIAAYKKAQSYFEDYLGKSAKKKDDVKEAKATIKGCKKVIKELTEVQKQIKASQSAPKTP